MSIEHRTGILKADVSSVSPSSERIKEFWEYRDLSDLLRSSIVSHVIYCITCTLCNILFIGLDNFFFYFVSYMYIYL